MVAHKSGICKTPGCNKVQWQDGFCILCGQYDIQKRTADNLSQLTGIMTAVVTGLANMESQIQTLNITQNQPIRGAGDIRDDINSKINYPKPGTSPKPDQLIPKSPLMDNSFIPSVNINEANGNIRQTKTSVPMRNLADVAKQLTQLKNKG